MPCCCGEKLTVEVAFNPAVAVAVTNPDITVPAAPTAIGTNIQEFESYIYPNGTITGNCTDIPASPFFPQCGINGVGTGPEYPNDVIGHAFSNANVINHAFTAVAGTLFLYQQKLLSFLGGGPATLGDVVAAKATYNAVKGSLGPQLVVKGTFTLVFNGNSSTYTPSDDSIVFSVVRPENVNTFEGSVLGGSGKYKNAKGSVTWEIMARDNISLGITTRLTFNSISA